MVYTNIRKDMQAPMYTCTHRQMHRHTLTHRHTRIHTRTHIKHSPSAPTVRECVCIQCTDIAGCTVMLVKIVSRSLAQQRSGLTTCNVLTVTEIRWSAAVRKDYCVLGNFILRRPLLTETKKKKKEKKISPSKIGGRKRDVLNLKECSTNGCSDTQVVEHFLNFLRIVSLSRANS